MRTLSFIGCGKLGMTLGQLFVSKKVFEIQDVLTTTASSAQEATGVIGAGRAISNPSELRPADVYLVAVPDARIVPCADELLHHPGLIKDGTYIVHCSGALSSVLLEPCAQAGAYTASVHPLASFADPFAAAARFAGTPCAVEGQPQAVAMLQEAFSAIGGKPFVLPTEAKLLYHSSAVIASNYLVTLAELAFKTIECAGVAPEIGKSLILGLMHRTLDNLETLTPQEALTGPVARGDMFLVQHQYAALAAALPHVAEFYARMANRTAEMLGRDSPFERWL